MILDIFLIVLLFSIFSFLHSLLASNKIKKELAKTIGTKIAFYRLFYNVTSLISFSVFYFLSPKPDIVIYDLHYPYDILTFVAQFLSFLGLIWSLKGINIKEFLGIEQIKRYLIGEYKIEDLDEKKFFRIEGAYKIVRHPIYFFLILFLGLRPTMNLFYLITYICMVIYFYIGSILEENKLVEKYGTLYREYQKRVPRLIPILFKIRS
ncbi:MAG: hypothetical protein N2249_01165 [Melioribacter sp.]|nr:hypothetical protein [Melioribacter sp.]